MLELDEQAGVIARNRQDRSEHLLILEERARFLPPGEKTLVSLYLRGQLHNRQMAHLLQINPSTLCRRVKRWLIRLSDPVVAAVIERPMGLSDLQRQIALGYFLFRKPRKKLAAEFDLTPFEIAQTIAYVRGWCGGIRQANKR